MSSELRRKLASVALIIALFVVWELLCVIFHVSDVILPRPSQVFATLWQRAPALWPHTVQTLYTHPGRLRARRRDRHRDRRDHRLVEARL